MHIIWYGEAAFKIDVKSQNEEISILTFPFDPMAVGLKLPRTITADIVLTPGENKLSLPVQGHGGRTPLIIQHQGEYEMKGVFCQLLALEQGNNDQAYLARIEAEDMLLVYCNNLAQVPDESDLQEIEGVDVLFVPVGGHGLLDAKGAGELISELQPRVVVPMNYKLPSLKNTRDSVEPFLKITGPGAERVEKLKLSRKDLPVDEMRVVVLEKS